MLSIDASWKENWKDTRSLYCHDYGLQFRPYLRLNPKSIPSRVDFIPDSEYVDQWDSWNYIRAPQSTDNRTISSKVSRHIRVVYRRNGRELDWQIRAKS